MNYLDLKKKYLTFDKLESVAPLIIQNARKLKGQKKENVLCVVQKEIFCYLTIVAKIHSTVSGLKMHFQEHLLILS